MSAKTLIFVFFVFAFPTLGQNVNPNSQSAEDSDGLARHISAADTFQISGDLKNAANENRAIVGIALQRTGRIAIEEGRFEEAAKILSDSLSYQDTAANRANLAVVYQRMNAMDKALIEAQKAVALDPDFFDGHYLLANIYFTKEDYTAALPELEKVFRIAPDLDLAFALGVTYLALKQPERARLLFEEVQIAAGKPSAELNLLFARAYQRTNYPLEAERELKRALEIDAKRPRLNFFLGYLILQQGGSERLPEAAAAFAEELKLTPDDYFCNFFAGVVATTQNDYDNAIRFLKRAVQLDPRRGEALPFLAQSQMETGDLAGAERSLRQAIALEGPNPEKNFQARRTHFLLGRVLLKSGRKEEAEKEMNIARALQEKSLETARDQISQILGQVAGEANKGADQDKLKTAVRVKLSPQRAAEVVKIKSYLDEVLARAFHNLGVIAIQEGRGSDAFDNFAAAARWKADFPGLDRNWGIVSFRAAKFEMAIPPLSRDLQANPGDALVRRMLGTSYYSTMNYSKAVETLRPLEPSITADPELAYIYGISMIRLNRNQDALPVFAKLAERSQNDSESLLYAAQGFMILGDFERAIKELQRISTLNPSLPKTNYLIGQSLIRLNRFNEAEKAFARELENNPSDYLSKYHLALTLIERKIAPERSTAILQEAVALKPDYADARYQLGKIFLERGETEKAIEQLESAVSYDANQDYIHYQLSIAYRKASRKEDADRALKRYQELKGASRRANSPTSENDNTPK